MLFIVVAAGMIIGSYVGAKFTSRSSNGFKNNADCCSHCCCGDSINHLNR